MLGLGLAEILPLSSRLLEEASGLNARGVIQITGVSMLRNLDSKQVRLRWLRCLSL